MAAVDYPAESRVRDSLHDISFFEQYRFTASPPFTPPMKGEARMADFRPVHTPTHSIHYALDKIFPRSPPLSPRNNLKRKFSNNLQASLSGLCTPPSTPPTRSRAGTLEEGNDDSVFQANRRPALSRPTIVTADFDASPSRRIPSRTSSYSSAVATPRSSKDALARCKDYAALSTDSQYFVSSPSPLFHSSGSSPPPNTPMNIISGMMLYTQSKQAGGALEPFPFSAGPSSLSTVQCLYLPRPEDFKLSGQEIEDFEMDCDVDSLPSRPRKRKASQGY